MARFMKKGVIFSTIIFCALNIVNSSSGVSQFQTSRGVEMRVVDSEDALISLPKSISMDINVIKQIINYYTISTIYVPEKSENILEVSEADGSIKTDIQLDSVESTIQTEAADTGEAAEAIENSEFQEVRDTKVAIEVKELVNTEEKINVTGNRCNLIIKNNMGSDIRLEKVEFDDPCLQSGGNGLFIGVGDSANVTINYNDTPDILNGDKSIKELESKAILFFSWNKGQSTIYQDVIINVTIEVKDPEEVIL